MHYTIEVMDERDKDSSEPWSFYGVYHDKQKMLGELQFLMSVYVTEHPIAEVRIKIEKNG